MTKKSKSLKTVKKMEKGKTWLGGKYESKKRMEKKHGENKNVGSRHSKMHSTPNNSIAKRVSQYSAAIPTGNCRPTERHLTATSLYESMRRSDS